MLRCWLVASTTLTLWDTASTSKPSSAPGGRPRPLNADFPPPFSARHPSCSATTYNGITVTTAAKENCASVPPAVLLETRVRGFAPKNATAIGLELSVSSTVRWGSWQTYDGTAAGRLVGLDYFGARYFSGAQGRFTSPDKPFVDQDPYEPQSWNLYSYVRNNPLKFVDETGREIVYANDRLRTISDQRRQQSPSYNSNLQGYEGQGSPRLTIQYGPTANDPDGSATNGVFSAQIAPSVQNCSSATDCTTIPARLNSGIITVNDGLQNNDAQTSSTLAHEVSHANDARTNPQRYSTEPIRDANGRIIPHDNRPVERRAIGGAQQSDRERQEYARQQREEQRRQRQEQRQREREERERRRRERQN